MAIFFCIAFLGFILLVQDVSAQKSGQELFTPCVGCHRVGMRMVGPDLKDITQRRSEEWLISFIQNSQAMVLAGDSIAVSLFNEYNKIPMPPQAYSVDEIKVLLNYLTNFSDSDQVALDQALMGSTVAPVEGDFLENNFSSSIPSFAWPFILAIIVFILSIIDLLFTNVLKFRLIQIDLILISLIAIVYILVFESINLGRSPGYEPDQPIKFSHRVHAGENQINCLYCHSGAAESRHSTIPATSLCLNCHTVIKNGKNTGAEEIAKIQQAMDNGKSIEWVKVHNLPDYVFFSHAQHVTVGKLDCKECHGDVATMGRVQQINDLSMGWCITCHRTKEVQMSTNDYYQTFTKLHEDFVSGKITKVTVDDIGGNNCAKCHY